MYPISEGKFEFVFEEEFREAIITRGTKTTGRIYTVGSGWFAITG